ncbi:MAG: MerR family transcriptional regulator [Thomasclavelia sp.]
MTMEEASVKYHIPIQVLKEYRDMGLCDEVKEVMGVWQYDETDIERLGTIMTLNDIGFNKDEIQEYMKLLLKNTDTSVQRKMMLRNKRSKTLDEIHFKEIQLMKIDYLTNEINQMKKKGEVK